MKVPSNRVSWHRTNEAADIAADKLRKKYKHDVYTVAGFSSRNSYRYEVLRGFTCHCSSCRMVNAL